MIRDRVEEGLGEGVALVTSPRFLKKASPVKYAPNPLPCWALITPPC